MPFCICKVNSIKDTFAGQFGECVLFAYSLIYPAKGKACRDTP